MEVVRVVVGALKGRGWLRNGNRFVFLWGWKYWWNKSIWIADALNEVMAVGSLLSVGFWIGRLVW